LEKKEEEIKILKKKIVDLTKGKEEEIERLKNEINQTKE